MCIWEAHAEWGRVGGNVCAEAKRARSAAARHGEAWGSWDRSAMGSIPADASGSFGSAPADALLVSGRAAEHTSSTLSPFHSSLRREITFHIACARCTPPRSTSASACGRRAFPATPRPALGATFPATSPVW